MPFVTARTLLSCIIGSVQPPLRPFISLFVLVELERAWEQGVMDPYGDSTNLLVPICARVRLEGCSGTSFFTRKKGGQEAKSNRLKLFIKHPASVLNTAEEILLVSGAEL